MADNIDRELDEIVKEEKQARKKKI